MRNRNHTLPLVAVGLFIACASPAVAADPSEASPKSAKDHDCSLPANIRNKVEHCHQVGDFGGPHRDDYRNNGVGPKSRFMPIGGPDPVNNKPVPGIGSQKLEKKSKQPKKLDQKKDQIIEFKSDSEPDKNTK